jgi:hypothetical protein
VKFRAGFTVFLVALVSGALALLILTSAASAYSLGWSLGGGNAPADNPPIYDYSDPAQRCAGTADRPDEPIRAFRFKNGNGDYRVQINFAGPGTQNRRMLGPTLDAVKREHLLTGSEQRDPACNGAYGTPGSSLVYKADKTDTTLGRAAPETFANFEWLNSPYYEYQSGAVYALVHNEFHGRPFAGYCSNNGTTGPDIAYGIQNCWLSSVTMVSSSGSEMDPPIPNALGALYLKQAAAPGHLVATIPHQYPANSVAGSPATDWGRNGYQAATNIFSPEGAFFYFMVSVAAPHDRPAANPINSPQKDGICVFRTTRQGLADPTSWRAWGGTAPKDYKVQMIDPYQSTDSPANHVCDPVSPGNLNMSPRSLTYNTYLQKYMLVGGSNGNVYYSLSDDLINWSDTQLLAKGTAGGTCPPEDPLGGYPSILDPNDPAKDSTPDNPNILFPQGNPNFDHPSRSPYLYNVRNNLNRSQSGCPHAADNVSLVRVPIRFAQQQATLEGSGGLTDPNTGYESTSSPPGAFSAQTSGPGTEGPYDGSKYAWAQSMTGSTSYGSLAANWREGDDVWYGTALYLPAGFAASNTKLHLMRWDDAPGTHYGGVMLDTDDQYYLVRGQTGGAETKLGPGNFTLTEGTGWIWVEVHQHLSADPTQAVSEVFVNGKPTFASLDANIDSGISIGHVRYGYVASALNPGQFSWMGLDRSSVWSGPIGDLRAPAPPKGLDSPTTTPTSVGLSWNSQQGLHYRVYRLEEGRAWSVVADDVPASGSSASYTDSNVDCGQPYQYRVTTYTGAGPSREEGVPSGVLNATTSACP